MTKYVPRHKKEQEMDAVLDLVLHKARKAAATFVVTIAGAVGTAMADGDLTQPEVIVAVGTALTATAAAYGFKNKA